MSKQQITTVGGVITSLLKEDDQLEEHSVCDENCLRCQRNVKNAKLRYLDACYGDITICEDCSTAYPTRSTYACKGCRARVCWSCMFVELSKVNSRSLHENNCQFLNASWIQKDFCS